MLIHWKERRRRMMNLDENVWRQGEVTDEGLRAAYDSLPRAPIRVLVPQLSKEVNHGGLLRAAEAFRIESISFSPEDDRAVDGSGHRGTRRWQPHEWAPIEAAFDRAVADGCQTVALTLAPHSVAIQDFRWRFPVALVIGSELYGIPKAIEARCEAAVAIPMFGLVESMNVAVATAMALQEAVRAYRAINPDFVPARQASRRLMGL